MSGKIRTSEYTGEATSLPALFKNLDIFGHINVQYSGEELARLEIIKKRKQGKKLRKELSHD
jgi:hypothetical protein